MNRTPVHRQAKALIDEGRTAEAVRLLERHLAQASDDHVARNMLAFAHFQAGDYRSAEVVYRTMVAVGDPDPRDLHSLGQTLVRQGKNGEARVWLAAAAAADPRFARAGGATAPPAHQAAPRPFPVSELAVPSDDELSEFTRRLRERDRAVWWTEHWYGLPWFARLGRLAINALVLLIAAIVIYGFATYPY